MYAPYYYRMHAAQVNSLLQAKKCPVGALFIVTI